MAAADTGHGADDPDEEFCCQRRLLLTSVPYRSNTLGRPQTTTTPTLMATTASCVDDDDFCGHLCSSTATTWRQITIQEGIKIITHTQT